MRSFVLAAVAALGLPVLLWAILPVPSAGSPAQHRLDGINHKLDQVQGQVGVRRRREQVLSTDIAAFTRRINSLGDRLAVLLHRQADVQARLDAERRQLEVLQAQLRTQRLRLARLRPRLATSRRALAARLVSLYKIDEPDIVTVVLEAKGFEQLIEGMDFAKRISDQDRRIVERVRVARDDTRREADRLAVLESRQRATAMAVETRRNEVSTLRAGVAGTKADVERERSARESQLSRVQVSRKRLENEIVALRGTQGRVRRALLRAQRATAAASTRAASAPTTSAPAGAGPAPAAGGSAPTSSGSFLWPASGPITSPFCERRAWEACHPGLDIGVPEGTPIGAAAAGTVVLLQPIAASGGYGNYTCIQHSRGLSSCYAHQSRFGTSSGARVSQGQVIGYVGNTGHSFGAHLHFEVRLNGSVVNPLNYLG